MRLKSGKCVLKRRFSNGSSKNGESSVPKRFKNSHQQKNDPVYFGYKITKGNINQKLPEEKESNIRRILKAVFGGCITHEYFR